MRYAGYFRHGCPWLVVGVALAIAGCGGSSGDAQVGGDYSKVRSMSGLYEMYRTANKGKVPPDEQAFRSFLMTKQNLLDQTNLKIDEMFESPRSGQQLEWVVGRKPPIGPNGMIVVAFEKEPVDGKRLVLATRGMYEVMDEGSFRTLFPQTP